MLFDGSYPQHVGNDLADSRRYWVAVGTSHQIRTAFVETFGGVGEEMTDTGIRDILEAFNDRRPVVNVRRVELDAVVVPDTTVFIDAHDRERVNTDSARKSLEGAAYELFKKFGFEEVSTDSLEYMTWELVQFLKEHGLVQEVGENRVRLIPDISGGATNGQKEEKAASKENDQGACGVDLLMHPGFEGIVDVDSSDAQMELSRSLYNKYVQAAEEMGFDEVMVVVTHTKKADFDRHKEEGAWYAKQLERLEMVLGDRLIISYSGYDATSDRRANLVAEEITQELKARNLILMLSILCANGGIWSITPGVVLGGNALNLALNLSLPTYVNVVRSSRTGVLLSCRLSGKNNYNDYTREFNLLLTLKRSLAERRNVTSLCLVVCEILCLKLGHLVMMTYLSQVGVMGIVDMAGD